MASFKTYYFGNLILSAAFSGTSFDAAMPATIYVVPYTVAPTRSGGGTQWTDAGISRVALTRNTTNFPIPTAAAISNATLMAFGTPVAGASIVGYGYIDASVGGNLWYYGDLAVPQVATAGVPFELDIGASLVEEE